MNTPGEKELARRLAEAEVTEEGHVRLECGVLHNSMAAWFERVCEKLREPRADVHDLIAPILPGWTIDEYEDGTVITIQAPDGVELTMATLDRVAEALGTRLIDVGSAGYWYGEHGVQITVRWP